MKRTFFLPICLLILSITGTTFSNLQFKREGVLMFSVTDDGNVIPNVHELGNPAFDATTKLKINHFTSGAYVPALWVNADGSVIIKNLIGQTGNDPVTFLNNTSKYSLSLFMEGNLYTSNILLPISQVDMYFDGHVVQKNAAGATISEFSEFGDGRIEYDLGNPGAEKRRFYLKDHLGTTRAVIDEGGSGVASETVIYDSYGKIIKSDISANELAAKEKFTGKEYDTSGFIAGGIATGLQLTYFGARYYDADVGTWTSADPMDQYWNSYSYCGGNPVNLVDQWGLEDNSTGQGDFTADFEAWVFQTMVQLSLYNPALGNAYFGSNGLGLSSIGQNNGRYVDGIHINDPLTTTSQSMVPPPSPAEAQDETSNPSTPEPAPNNQEQGNTHSDPGKSDNRGNDKEGDGGTSRYGRGGSAPSSGTVQNLAPFVIGSLLHPDVDKLTGEDLWHYKGEHGDYRFNKMGELVEDGGRLSKEGMSRGAKNAMKVIAGKKPGFFLKEAPLVGKYLGKILRTGGKAAGVLGLFIGIDELGVGSDNPPKQ